MKNIPIEQMDVRRLRVELSSALTANRLLNELVEKLKAEKRTLQKAREREKYTLRQKQKNARRLHIQIALLKVRVLKLNALEAAGVDNWEGYNEALDILREWKEQK